MKVENDYPKFYVIAETKLNNQSFENSIQECEKFLEKEWLNKWKKRNINTVCSDVEKILETFNFFLKEEDENDKNTIDYNKNLLKNKTNEFNNYLKHIYITIVFANTSFSFVTNLKDFKGYYNVSDINIKRINFWLPSTIENEKDIAFKIGQTLVNFLDNIKKYYFNLVEKNKNIVPQNKINEFLNYILPQSVTYTSVVSGNLYEWKEFIVNKTQFECHDETRYILMHLLRVLKMKWPTLCDDIMLCDNKGSIYSIDSLITNSSSYKNFCVKRVM